MTEHEIELNEQGQARRRFLKQAAVVGWGAPMIVTMMSRAASAQPQQCGTTALDLSVDPPALFCNVTQGCGTALVCAPEPGVPGAGNPCFCQSGPG